ALGRHGFQQSHRPTRAGRGHLASAEKPAITGGSADGRRAMVDFTGQYDVLVVGGGNAALCAALTAREAGGSVPVAEAAPRDFRGGNSRHTRNVRAMHEQPTAVLTDAYLEDEYW